MPNGFPLLGQSRGLFCLVSVLAFALMAAAQSTVASGAHGPTPLIDAAVAGDTDSVKALVEAGAKLDATDAAGRTALIAAVEGNQPATVKTLVAAGADINREARGMGSALNVAENSGNSELAAWLRAHGAHSTGKSIGDTVCVRPWGGQGYCGVVKSFTVRLMDVSVTRLVGCEGGCPARQECSASNPVGGVNGLHVGEEIAIPSWCLTDTGVKPETEVKQ